MTNKKTGSSADVEADALGQGEVGAVVDGVGGSTHVLLPGVGAGFAASSGFFFAAEGSADLCARGADVDVGDAAVGAGCGEELLGLPQIHGEDTGGEALGDVVVEAERVLEVGVFENVEDGGEGFVLDYTRLGVDVGIGLGGDFDEGGADVERV